MSRLPRQEEILVAAPHPGAFDFLAGCDGIQVVPVGLRGDTSWARMAATHTRIPALAHELGVDVVMGPNFIAPLWGRFHTAVMVHDLTFRRHPETTTLAKRWYYNVMVRHSVRTAARVFVGTRIVADELVEFAPHVADRVRLTPEGVSPAYLENGDSKEDRPGRGDSGDACFLFVGTLEPRKNLARLLAAHGNLCRQQPTFPGLRVVGGKGWEDAEIWQAVEGHPDPQRLHLLGYCTPEALKREYDQALAFVFPTLYEGFGLPVLEAMARGCPVLTSRGIATEEVAQDAALLVDPREIGDIERGLHRLAVDPSLRRRLRAAGRARVAEFSWERCARQTLAGLRELSPMKVK
jgi:glycosyltransferase involved in cell wall biosynthesis